MLIKSNGNRYLGILGRDNLDREMRMPTGILDTEFVNSISDAFQSALLGLSSLKWVDDIDYSQLDTEFRFSHFPESEELVISFKDETGELIILVVECGGYDSLLIDEPNSDLSFAIEKTSNIDIGTRFIKFVNKTYEMDLNLKSKRVEKIVRIINGWFE